MGRHWIDAALAVGLRFLIDLRLGPRTLESAAERVTSVALACRGVPPLLLVDDHLPYPSAIPHNKTGTVWTGEIEETVAKSIQLRCAVSHDLGPCALKGLTYV